MTSGSAGAASLRVNTGSAGAFEGRWQPSVASPTISEDASPALSAGQSGLSSEKACLECGRTKTPMWRNGPDGQKSLCNACGVRQQRRDHKEKLAKEAHSGDGEGSSEDARRALPAGMVSARRQSLNMLRGRPCHSMGSALDFVSLQGASANMPISPYTDELSLRAVPVPQQKRKPPEASAHAAGLAPTVRKRSCLWFEGSALDTPCCETKREVEALDLIINKKLAGNLGSMSAVEQGGWLCIRPVKVALRMTPQASWALQESGEAPFLLTVFAENGREVAVARPAESPMAACSYSEALAAYLWDSQAGWQVASRDKARFDLFKALLSDWQQSLVNYAKSTQRMEAARRQLSESLSEASNLQRALNRTSSEQSMRSERTSVRAHWKLQQLGPGRHLANGRVSAAAEAPATLSQYSSQLSPRTPLLAPLPQLSHRHPLSRPFSPPSLSGRQLQPDAQWGWPISPVTRPPYASQSQLGTSMHASGVNAMPSQRSLRTSNSGSSELMEQLARHSLLAEDSHLDPLDPLTLAKIRAPSGDHLDEALASATAPPMDGDLPDIPAQVWQEDSSDQTSAMLSDQHAEGGEQHERALLGDQEAGCGSPQSLHNLPGCMTPPLWEGSCSQPELTARQSSNMAHATRQALKHVAPGSTDSSPRLLHSLSLPAGHCSVPFGADEMAFVGSSLGNAASHSSALLADASAWAADLGLNPSPVPSPPPEPSARPVAPGNDIHLLSPESASGNQPEGSKAGRVDAAWPSTPQGQVRTRAPAMHMPLRA